MTQKNELEEMLINFFDKENKRYWKLYESILSQDVELVVGSKRQMVRNKV